jgi:hypothetical protein
MLHKLTNSVSTTVVVLFCPIKHHTTTTTTTTISRQAATSSEMISVVLSCDSAGIGATFDNGVVVVIVVIVVVGMIVFENVFEFELMEELSFVVVVVDELKK